MQIKVILLNSQTILNSATSSFAWSSPLCATPGEYYTVYSGAKASRPDWPRGQNFGFGLSLGLDKLASVSGIWPRPGLGLVNLASKNVLSNAKQ